MQTKYDFMTDRELERAVEYALQLKLESDYRELLQEMLNRFSNLVK